MPGDTHREAVSALNAWTAEEAERALPACCASSRWVAAVAGGRPYGGWTELAAASSAAIKAIRWSDVLEALDAHPRIGDRAAGESREAEWSRAEQSAAASADAAVLGVLARVNAEYERRFGHVFLICASGRPAEQILAEARRRLGNDAAAEQQEVRAELAAIALLRLERLAETATPATPATSATPATGIAASSEAGIAASPATGLAARGKNSAESASAVTGAAG
jgi:2-oxo-4-hydroxy-4-carboxy-5-ureidoimidazoline decarboxylase